MLSHLLSMIANRLIFSSIQTEPLCLVLVTCHHAPWWTSSSLQACVTDCTALWVGRLSSPFPRRTSCSDDRGKGKLSRQLFSRPLGLKVLEFSSELLLIGLWCSEEKKKKNSSFLSFTMFCKIIGHRDLVVPKWHKNSDQSNVIAMIVGKHFLKKSGAESFLLTSCVRRTVGKGFLPYLFLAS